MRDLRGLLAAAVLLLGGCAALSAPPGPVSREDRLAALPVAEMPVSAPVTIRWSDRLIPFVEAGTDADAAFALGLVHAHLRLGQMAFARRVVEGRISESAGPFAVEIDHAIRAFGFGRAAREIYAGMPAESRLWLDRFAEGINHYAARLGPGDWPHEFAVLDMGWEPWRPEDSIALGRATGVDINWFTLIRLLGIEDAAVRDRVLARLSAALAEGAVSFGDGAPVAGLDPLARLAGAAAEIGRTGSNSIVVAPGRSASGAALIANDPHLGFFIPNAWLIAGLRTPDAEIVGMMVPGTPVFAFGRTPHLAWGGTNLRATTSELVDVTGLAPGAIEVRGEVIGTRSWPDTQVTVRTTPYGPVMSDVALLPQTGRDIAVRWVGHGVSDEITAMLGAMRAQSVDEFRAAMAGFALPPQTFLVADRAGRIAGVVATHVPARPDGDPLRVLASPERSDRHWQGLYTAADLPAVADPPGGVLVSANNRPAPDGARPFGGFFPQDERVRRLRELTGGAGVLSLDDLRAMQMDTVSPLSREWVAALAPRLAAWAPRSEAEAEAIRLILGWDGDYATDSRPALVFESLMIAFVPAAQAALGQVAEGEVYAALGRERAMLLPDLGALEPWDWREVLGPALTRAAATAASGRVWGDVHRLDVAHLLARLPLIGERYLIETIPVPGTRETVFKTSHDPADTDHRARFGAQARHLSDMADPDANWFVLLGGQDGWISSPAFADQVELWRTGQLVRVPLTPGAVAGAFPHVTVLRPGG